MQKQRVWKKKSDLCHNAFTNLDTNPNDALSFPFESFCRHHHSTTHTSVFPLTLPKPYHPPKTFLHHQMALFWRVTCVHLFWANPERKRIIMNPLMSLCGGHASIPFICTDSVLLSTSFSSLSYGVPLFSKLTRVHDEPFVCKSAFFHSFFTTLFDSAFNGFLFFCSMSFFISFFLFFFIEIIPFFFCYNS